MASPLPLPTRGRIIGTRPRLSSDIIPDHLRPSIISPSASSVSINSQLSTSHSSVDENDISSIVTAQARNNPSHVAAASASTRLVCPICTEEMMTLLQLNRHIDDQHGQLEEKEQEEVKSWFRTQMVKAKKFQPLAVINQKLKGLDRFESNEELRSTGVTPLVGSPMRPSTPDTMVTLRADSDDVVTKEHWQKQSANNTCSDPMCGKRLTGANGHVNCRKCGKLFCEEHTMYQMKLSRTAQHEPARGYWSRVCETCYKSRDGYNDHAGFGRDLMSDFASSRRKAIDKTYLEVSRLEKRLTKLTQILADPLVHQEQGVYSYLRSFSGAPTRKRIAEQSVVDWEEDTKVSKCPFCQQEFVNYSFRRHHCRLCGRVVCADPTTACSSKIPLSVETCEKNSNSRERTYSNLTPAADNITEKGNQIPIDVRMCRECQHTVFSKSDFARELAYEPVDQRTYQNLKQFEKGIRNMLPRFQKLLQVLQDPDTSPTQTQLTDATKVRKRLTDAFTQYSIAATRLRDLPTTSPTQTQLQKQVYAQSMSFLHIHMLPLKSLPKILKHATPDGPSHRSSRSIDGHLAPPSANYRRNSSSPLAAIRSEAASSESAISSLETEEKELRERLIVLEEQKFMVGEMMADAQRRRKFEEVEALARNIEDLGIEINGVMGQLGQLQIGFEEAFLGVR